MSRGKLKKDLVILMIGAPGVGKGTYSRMLSKDLNIPELSSGEELRKLLKSDQNNNNQQISRIRNLMDKGQLVDDEFIFNFMKEKLSRQEYSKGVILDGYPRNINQAIQFKNLRKMDLVINIELDENILIKKLLGRRVCINCGKNYNICCIKEGDYDMEPLLPKKSINNCDECNGNLVARDDDSESIIKERISLYKEVTRPLENYYIEEGILKKFIPKKGIKDYPILLELVEKSFL